jgi:hypothetical protein
MSAAPQPLLVAIATAPRRTMRGILERPEPMPAISLVLAAAVSIALRDIDVAGLREVALSFGNAMASLIVIALLTAATLVALVMFYACLTAAMWSGRTLLGGAGTLRDIRLALAWGVVPQILAMSYRLPALFFWSGDPPRARAESIGVTLSLSASGAPSDSWPYLILELAFAAWYLFVASRALGEAQRFSSWKGLANLLLAIVGPLIALLVIAAAAFLTIRVTA